MNWKKFFLSISQLSATIVGLIPIALCFGFMVEQPEVFVHNLFSIGIYGLLTFIVSFVLAHFD